MTGLVWRWTFDGKGRHSAAVLGYACRGNKTSIVSSLPQEFYENAHVRAIAQKCSAPSRIFDGPGGVPGIRAEGCRYGSHAASGSRRFLLWKVASPTATVYLLGSVHVATPEFYPLPDAMESAFAA